MMAAILRSHRLGIAVLCTLLLYFPAVGLSCLLAMLETGPPLTRSDLQVIAILEAAFFLTLALPLFVARSSATAWSGAVRLGTEMASEQKRVVAK